MVDKAGGLKGARYAPTASGGKPLTPPSLTHRSLCHAVYARLLHSGIETAQQKKLFTRRFIHSMDAFSISMTST